MFHKKSPVVNLIYSGQLQFSYNTKRESGDTEVRNDEEAEIKRIEKIDKSV